ncbi:MAG: AbrB/MazE/SpoVT family DNA-binding domain-containing protein [bacterium]|nr:AbrB/MazE/SpoVT family DNA-binding domain-containing protein [bacterium]
MEHKVLKEVILDSYTMEEALVTAKKWGNSLGVILPSELVQTEHIKPGEELIITVERKHTAVKDLFGKLQSKKSADQVLKEFRKDFKESKWL